MQEDSREPNEGPASDLDLASFAAVVQSFSDAIISHRLDGLIVSWNDGAEGLYRYSRAEMLGRSITLLTASAHSAEERRMLEQARRGESAHSPETYRLAKNDRSVCVSLTVSPIRNREGTVAAIVHIAREVKPRTKNDEAAAQLAAIIGSSDDAVISKSLDGVIQTWNAGAERLYGFSADEVVGQPMMNLLPKSLIEQERKLLESMRKGERVDHFETVRVHKEGRPIPVSISLSPIYNSQGEIVGISHISRDISEAVQLKDRVQMSQRMEAVGRLAGGISHDFNNLLTIISGYGVLLRAGLRNDPVHQSMTDEMIGAAEKAAELTKQLLAFSRGQAVRFRPVDLNDVLTKMQPMLRRLIGEDIEIRLLLEKDLPPILADTGQISQIVMNLTANARDALPGGGRMIIQTGKWVVEDDLFHAQLGFSPGKYVRLLFSDNGHGMDPETCKHIFEPFFTTKEIGRGTGLGLSTVYGIVKQTGGQISVYSEVGSGTVFAIYLPCAESAIPAYPTQELKSAQGCETILLVEDEPGLRKLAESILQANGYKVLSAAGPEDALAKLDRHSEKIALLLTDIVMPGMDGQKLVSEVATRVPSIRPVFMSGYSEHAVLESILNDPGAAFLQKPFTPVQLLEKIREVLDSRAPSGN